MKLRQLESLLQPVEAFDKPKLELEQYPTSAHLASLMLFTAESSFGDIQDRRVIDLGTGPGTLAIGAAMLGASDVVGIDVDPDALEVAQRNLVELEAEEEVDLILADVARVPSMFAIPERVADAGGAVCNTVVMNPPFGTRAKGADVMFLQTALRLCDTAVYSLHKSSTRAHLARKAQEWGVDFRVLAEMKFDVPKMYKFHKKDSVDIAVDFVRLSHRPKPGPGPGPGVQATSASSGPGTGGHN